VSIADAEYEELHRAKLELPDRSIAIIGVSEVREMGLDVVADPDPDDPRHALITGIPDRTLGDQQTKEAAALVGLPPLSA